MSLPNYPLSSLFYDRKLEWLVFAKGTVILVVTITLTTSKISYVRLKL